MAKDIEVRLKEQEMLTKIPDRLQSYPTLECLRRKLDLF